MLFKLQVKTIFLTTFFDCNLSIFFKAKSWKDLFQKIFDKFKLGKILFTYTDIMS